MDLTTTHLELLFAAHELAQENRGMVITAETYPAAHELAEHGWLERRFEPNGDMSWWWTPAAETALALGNLATPPEGANLN
ncbi:MAG: hypothetical protein ACXVUL_21110 [Solirubrobacteraceae bacterium]